MLTSIDSGDHSFGNPYVFPSYLKPLSSRGKNGLVLNSLF